MRIIAHHRAVNLTETERIVSAVAGGLLAGAAVAGRNRWALPLAVAGGDLLRRAITGHSYLYEAVGLRRAPVGQGAAISVPYELGIRVDHSVTVARPPEEIYRFWRDLSNLPRFMSHLVSVRELEGRRSHWVANAPAGRTVEWDAVIHNEVPDELLAWRSLPGAGVDHAGTVLFRPLAGGRATEVSVELQYNPPAGTLGAMAARLWRQEPGQQIAHDLNRFKSIIEGDRSDRLVEEASEESFPASDAPAYSQR